MSRAFSPPDTLSQDNVKSIADVRRTVWINGFLGLGVGSVTGMLGHIVLQKMQSHYVGDTTSVAQKAQEKTKESFGWIQKCLRPLPPLGRNTFLLSVLGGGALGSFVMSTTAGKNAVHLLHPVFQVGRDEHAGQSPYQIAIAKAKELEGKLAATDTQQSQTNEDELDVAHHRARSLRRKGSMKRRLESGHSLSDTHGNTWPYSEEDALEETKKKKAMNRADAWDRRQTQRRDWVHEKIERGKALSNSTGGHWKEN
ncbi:predicted protein [Thalassiosira pseudonana CCMP1335]|uniref:Uncharacterized protein n=1 Tax=Thalassiosira pseudonana TaxID=35128 RepID=B8LDJ9_THAPS|nr:predicted protein [Thalassiosira pseudonana CCMP1335]EED86563.1 predicted protein [Thalassiosira pseudonana CCMP1335]|eukprot:scaffold14461_cov207-Alexandrium_tamarense.AAC.5